MIRLLAAPPPESQVTMLWCHARDIAAVVNATPQSGYPERVVRSDARDGSVQIHSSAVSGPPVCDACGMPAWDVHVTVTAAVGADAVELLGSATVPHRCRGWVEQTLRGWLRGVSVHNS